MAVKNNVDLFYFEDTVPLQVFFTEDGRVEKHQYVQIWKSIPDSNERRKELSVASADVDLITRKLENRNIFSIARRKVSEKVKKRKFHTYILHSISLFPLTYKLDENRL
jgi:AP-1 complex subunit beta-1